MARFAAPIVVTECPVADCGHSQSWLPGEARNVFLTSEQRKRLLDQCAGSFSDLIEAGMLTGARYGELRTVQVFDYDKTRRVLSIRQGETGPQS